MRSADALAVPAQADEDYVTQPIPVRHRILVVDDRAENLLAAEVALTGLDALIVTALSGEAALKYLLEADYSLVLLDVNMPNMDGYETARYIRSRPRSAHVPIIFMTAHVSDEKNLLRAYELGAVDFLVKPVAPEILRAKSQQLLAIQERTDELARLRGQRELELERQRFQDEHMRQLVEADDRKNEFLAILAHELRNPLAPLRALFDLAKFAPTQPLTERMLEIGDRQISLLTRLVDDLLDISRITTNKLELRPEIMDLRSAIEAAVATSKPRLSDRGHTLSTDLPEDPVMVTLDSLRFVQVIANLLNNAARYTPPGGKLRIGCGTSGEDHAFVEVEDNGIGIPTDLLPTIFGMFVQERVRSDGSGGLGLGLALAKQLVELHGGTITAASEGRGLGSTFRIELPLATTELALRPRTRSSDLEPMQPEARPLRIIVVDDNEDARELIAETLQAAGHDVRVAPDGPSGLDLILALRPDAAFIDIGLPGMNGVDVVRELRARVPDLATKLVAFTGYCGAESIEKSRQAGFDDHLIKPATLEKMLGCLPR
ncbi:MAG: response regulator [Kofleriaceae bacterium]